MASDWNIAKVEPFGSADGDGQRPKRSPIFLQWFQQLREQVLDAHQIDNQEFPDFALGSQSGRDLRYRKDYTSIFDTNPFRNGQGLHHTRDDRATMSDASDHLAER
jgi:hypothetical protein